MPKKVLIKKSPKSLLSPTLKSTESAEKVVVSRKWAINWKMNIQTGHTSFSTEYQEDEASTSAGSDKLSVPHFNYYILGGRPDGSRQTALKMNKQHIVRYLIRVDWSLWNAAAVNYELFSRGWRCASLLYWCKNNPPAVLFSPTSKTTNVRLHSITWTSGSIGFICRQWEG